MRVRYADWRRPTDADYAFPLRPTTGPGGFAAEVPPLGISQDIRQIAREVLEDGHGERFERLVHRWSGPEDVDPTGGQPYLSVQLHFEERTWTERLLHPDVEAVLRGTALVLRRENGQTDYILRDHHTLDVLLYHYRTTGALPTGLFHADRHSDWCRDRYLLARRPAQAATWWTLLEGFKRPQSGTSVLGEREVIFTTAQPAAEVLTAGRDIGASTLVPWWVDAGALAWPAALAQLDAVRPDWVSLDLDYFMPLVQLRLTRGLLRDPRMHALMHTAMVRVFVLSPQFARGGDLLTDWTVQGGLDASLRMLNLVRGMRIRPSDAAGAPSF